MLCYDFFKKKLASKKSYCLYLHHNNAEVAQLVELQPSKLVVASSSLVFRSVKNLKQTFQVFLFYMVKAVAGFQLYRLIVFSKKPCA